MNKRSTFGVRLFYSVISLFAIFTLVFVIYQFSRERSYKVALINAQLQAYNHAMYEGTLKNDQDSLSTDKTEIEQYIKTHNIEDLRITIITEDGNVIYDNNKTKESGFTNHLDRNEVKSALTNGSGYAINRQSATTGTNYFYSATHFPLHEVIIRSALPYNTSLITVLQADYSYLWFALAIFVALTFILLQFTRNLGATITKLRDFAVHAAKNEPLDKLSKERFPDDELGEISQNIVTIYENFLKSLDDKTRLKQQLTQNIAHELKTPVSSIQGYLETIINNPNIDPEKRAKFIERCYAQTERLAHLINDISILNRLDDNSTSLRENESINIAQMVKDIGNQVTLQLEKHNIRFNNLLPDPLIVNGNRSLLYSIFRNLTDNAIIYAGEGSIITIKCDTSNQEFYQFTFYDNGIGVPSEHLEKIFERFYRIDKGRSRAMGGTGLGLSIVKNAVLHHGGTITAHNQPGGGLAINFTIHKG
ncbi:MAG: histidine kinase [Odoribacter sp.]|nr:histidine kinase [Odoribacter sp.]